MAIKHATPPFSFSATVFIAAFMFSGCAGRAASSSEAIQHAKTLHMRQQQTDYLVAQAKAFLSVKDYQEAVKTIRYVLASVDSNSEAAKQVLEQANRQLAQDMRAAVGEDKPKL